MPKHKVVRHKPAARYAHTARPRPRRKTGHGNGPRPEMAQGPPPLAVSEPKPVVVEVVDLEFPDPEEVPYREEALVTDFEDEDF